MMNTNNEIEFFKRKYNNVKDERSVISFDSDVVKINGAGKGGIILTGDSKITINGEEVIPHNRSDENE